MEFILVWLTLVTVASLFSQRSDATTASLYLPQGNAREGDESAMLTCRVDDPPDDYEAVFIRELNSGAMDIIFMQGRVMHEKHNKYSVSRRGEHSFALTLWNISREDTGNYVCRIGVPTGTTSTGFVASGAATLDVFYLPDTRVSPHCSILDRNNRPVDLDQQPQLGDSIRLQCLSQAGNPIVDMKWIQNGMAGDIPNSKPSRPSSHSGVVVSVLDLTILPEHQRVEFSCVITSSGFHAFSRNCTIGPFVSPSATHPPPLTHTHIDPDTLATTKTIRSKASVGPSDKGILSTLGLPILAGVPAAVLFLILIIIIFVVVRRQRRRPTDFKHRESQAHLITIGLNGHAGENGHVAENGNLKRESKPVQHVVSPNGGQLYAVVQKSKLEEHEPDVNSNKETPTNTPKTLPLPTVYMTPAQKTKFYPPPPAYPTQHQQAELNKILDKNDNPSVGNATGKQVNKPNPPRSIFENYSSTQNDRTIRADLTTHEYATLSEVSPSSGEDSPVAPRSQRNNPIGLYNTVKLY